MRFNRYSAKTASPRVDVIATLRKELNKTIDQRQNRIDKLKSEQTAARKAVSDLTDSATVIQYQVVIKDTDSYQTGSAYPAVEALDSDLETALNSCVRQWKRNTGSKLSSFIDHAPGRGIVWKVRGIINGQVIEIPADVYQLLIERETGEA